MTLRQSGVAIVAAALLASIGISSPTTASTVDPCVDLTGETVTILGQDVTTPNIARACVEAEVNGSPEVRQGGGATIVVGWTGSSGIMVKVYGRNGSQVLRQYVPLLGNGTTLCVIGVSGNCTLMVENL